MVSDTMDSIQSEICLPPGLYLPLAEESTEKYRAEYFRGNDVTHEDVVDLACFAVALNVLAAPVTGRVNVMPQLRDFRYLRSMGYGIHWRRFDEFGGLTKIQSDLGFFADGVLPSTDAVVERL
jgi:hypothetical protein